MHGRMDTSTGTGVGTVEMQTVNGNQIRLNRVLFVPNATVRLISVFSINNDGDNICHFNATGTGTTKRGEERLGRNVSK